MSDGRLPVRDAGFFLANIFKYGFGTAYKADNRLLCPYVAFTMVKIVSLLVVDLSCWEGMLLLG